MSDDIKDVLTEIRDGLARMDQRQTAQLDTMIDLVRGIHGALISTSDTFTDHTRRLARLEARVDQIEESRR